MSDKRAAPPEPLLPEAALVWVGGKEKWELAYRADYRRHKVKTLVDNILFNASGQIYTSNIVECAPYRNFLILIDMKVSGSPTDIVIATEFSDDRTNFYEYVRGPFGDLRYVQAQGNRMESIDGPVLASYMRLKLTSTDCTGSDTFTATVKAILTG